MPNAVDTQPAPGSEGSVQGRDFTFTSDEDRRTGLDVAFDYRGDLTVKFKNGETVEGYLFNREPDGKPPTIQLFVKGEDTPRVYPYGDVVGINFTGKDPADGKSYQTWKTKKAAERAVEAQQVEAEMREKGYL